MSTSKPMFGLVALEVACVILKFMKKKTGTELLEQVLSIGSIKQVSSGICIYMHSPIQDIHAHQVVLSLEFSCLSLQALCSLNMSVEIYIDVCLQTDLITTIQRYPIIDTKNTTHDMVSQIVSRRTK